MSDRTRPLKLECLAESGSITDYIPTEVNPNQDGVDCNALFLQSTSSADSTVYINRSAAGAMTFVDPTVGNKALNRLVSNSLSDSQSHQALLDIVHFLSDGPGDGWASGAVRIANTTAVPSTGWVWYTSSAQSARIIDYTLTYPTGSLLPSSRQYRLYATDGKTVVRTLTDALVWTGPVLTQKTRTWS